ncbi:SMP-30/gluconolactonase/LRE family protein [Rhodococcus aetherivorans]
MFEESTFRLVGSGLRCPEGPVVEEDGSVLVCEVQGGALVRVSPEGVRTVVADLGSGVNGAAIGPDGAAYVATNGSFTFAEVDGITHITGLIENWKGGAFYRVDRTNGEVEELFTESEGAHLGSLNDVVFDADGGAYIADTTSGLLHYAVPAERRIGVAVSDVVTPNGVGLSPDGSRLYVSETFTGRLRAFEVLGPGKLQELPDVFQHPAAARDDTAEIDLQHSRQLWDGLAVDGEGNIVVADLAGSGVRVIDPNGTELAFLETPEHDPYVTCVAFGGPDGRTAYVTSGGRGLLYAIDNWPFAGGRVNFQS